MHASLILGDGNDLSHVEPKTESHRQEKDDDGYGLDETYGGEGRNGAFVNAVINFGRNPDENADRNQNDEEINHQADERPELAAAGFEKRRGRKS